MDKIEKMENVSWPSSSTSLLTRGVFPLAASLAVKFYTISPVDLKTVHVLYKIRILKLPSLN